MDKSENNNLKEQNLCKITNYTDEKRLFSWWLSPKTCYILKDAFAREQIDSLRLEIKTLKEEIEELKIYLTK